MAWFPRRHRLLLCSYYPLHQEPALWYASCFPHLPLVLLQFLLPEIYASCNWSVRQLRVKAMARILSWFYFPEQESRRKCSDFTSFREQTVSLWEVGRLGLSLLSDHKSAVGLALELKVWTSAVSLSPELLFFKILSWCWVGGFLTFLTCWKTERMWKTGACSREQISHSWNVGQDCDIKTLLLFYLRFLLTWTFYNLGIRLAQTCKSSYLHY